MKELVMQVISPVVEIYGMQSTIALPPELNLIVTALVERSFGNKVPVKVTLSPPSKLSGVAGDKSVNVPVMVSAAKLPSTGIRPRVLVMIGKWSPIVGSESKVH